MWNGGTLVTASNLVFQGTADGWLYAYDAATGVRLWKFYADNGISAPPITYEVGGHQYVTVLAGYGSSTAAGGKLLDMGWRYGKHPSRVLTFVLGGTGKLASAIAPGFSVHPVYNPKMTIDETLAKSGERLWNHTFLLCHGVNAASAGTIAPDLRESQSASDFTKFKALLVTGALRQGGMPPFSDLSDKEIRELYYFVRMQARDAATGRANPNGSLDLLH
jgi:quinohemoprotein ethanol dehydrogenase